MTRRRHPIAIVVAAVLAAALSLACVPKGKHEEVQAALEECRRDKTAAQEAAQACEERSAAEAERWTAIEENVGEALPQALREFEAEKQEIIELVPQEVQKKVDTYLSEFATAVSQSFAALREDNTQMMTQLAATRARLEELGVRTESIDVAIGSRLERQTATQEQMRADAAAIIARIQDFDRDYVNDKTSDERLRLNRKERETITLFHDQLVAELNALGRGGAAATEKPMAPPAAAPAAEETGDDDAGA